DISGYTEYMLANQIAAVHGQRFITSLIESLIREVEIPLVLQEIEGDALFLYARDPGDEAGWRGVRAEVARKLLRFFQAFSEAVVSAQEANFCNCPLCKNVDVKLKIVVHAGEAVFHQIDRFSQVSGVDVILAHRLLKNSVRGSEYLLLTESARQALGAELA